jgi:hypothetical protein
MTLAVVSVRYLARLDSETARRKLAQPAIATQVLRSFGTALEASERNLRHRFPRSRGLAA